MSSNLLPLRSASISFAVHASSAQTAVLTSRMVLNVLVDTLLGAVPIIGTIFDIYFRANERNLQLLVDSIERHRRP